MTTIAMIAGMVPSALGIGAGAEFRSPMAIAVIGGLLRLDLAVAALRSRLLRRHGRCDGWRSARRLERRDRGLPRQTAGAARAGRPVSISTPRLRETGRIIERDRADRASARMRSMQQRRSLHATDQRREPLRMREDWTRSRPILDLDEETSKGLIAPVFPGCRIIEMAPSRAA